MPRQPDGSFIRTNGNFQGAQVWQQQANSADKTINSNRHDTHDQDMSDALADSLSRTGKGGMQADLDLGNNAITGGSNTAGNALKLIPDNRQTTREARTQAIYDQAYFDVADADFGGVDPTGATLSTAAFQACAARIIAAGKGIMVSGEGDFALDDEIQVGGSKFGFEGRGEGTNLIQTVDNKRIWVDDGVTGKTELTLRNFKMTGRWEANQTLGTDNDRHINVQNFDTIIFENIFSNFCRQMAITAQAKRRIVAKGMKVWHCARDGLNFSVGQAGSPKDGILIDDYQAMHINDDAIACHVPLAGGNPTRRNVQINNINLFDCFGVKILGAVNLNITQMVADRLKGYGVRTGSDTSFNEGLNDNVDVTIIGAIIKDVLNASLFGFGSQRAFIDLRNRKPTAGGVTAVPPGQFDYAGNAWIKPEDYWYSSNGDPATTPSSGGWRHIVMGCQLANTLPQTGVTKYTDWPDQGSPQSNGRAFTAAGWTDPAISDHYGGGTGIRLENINDGWFGPNMIHGMQDAHLLADTIRWWNLNFSGDFKRIRRGVIANDQTGQSPTDWNTNIRLHNFKADLDPYLEHPNRTTGPVDGSWQTVGAREPNLVNGVNLKGILIEDGTLKNAYTMINTNATTSFFCQRVTQYCEPGSPNKGLRDIVRGGPYNLVVFEDSDPQSSTYGQLSQGMPSQESGSAPTSSPVSSGFYYRGYIIWSTAPTSTHAGWRRLTTGNAHVINTDWVSFA